jgi:hypothetical protein
MTLIPEPDDDLIDSNGNVVGKIYTNNKSYWGTFNTSSGGSNIVSASVVVPNNIAQGQVTGISWSGSSSQYQLFPNNSLSPIVKINSNPGEENLVSFYDKQGSLIVRILVDGTVQTFKLGADEEAARNLYEALEIHGVTLNKKIELLESQLKMAKKALKNIDTAILSTDTNPKAVNIKDIAARTLEDLK